MYEMSEDEYKSHWQTAQWRVFRPDRKIPDRIFREGFKQAFYKYAGIHFDEEFYSTLQNALLELGEDRFAIVGDPDFDPKGQSRFVYPADLEWQELTEQKGMQYFHRNFSDQYYIFGEREDWGLYSFTVEFGLIIAGYEASAARAFESRFTRDTDEIARWTADVLELTSDDFERCFRENYLSGQT